MSDDLNARAIALYDAFTHEHHDRRTFMAQMVALAGSAAAAEALIAGIAASPAAAQQVAANDAQRTTAGQGEGSSRTRRTLGNEGESCDNLYRGTRRKGVSFWSSRAILYRTTSRAAVCFTST